MKRSASRDTERQGILIPAEGLITRIKEQEGVLSLSWRTGSWVAVLFSVLFLGVWTFAIVLMVPPAMERELFHQILCVLFGTCEIALVWLVLYVLSGRLCLEVHPSGLVCRRCIIGLTLRQREVPREELIAVRQFFEPRAAGSHSWEGGLEIQTTNKHLRVGVRLPRVELRYLGKLIASSFGIRFDLPKNTAADFFLPTSEQRPPENTESDPHIDLSAAAGAEKPLASCLRESDGSQGWVISLPGLWGRGPLGWLVWLRRLAEVTGIFLMVGSFTLLFTALVFYPDLVGGEPLSTWEWVLFLCMFVVMPAIVCVVLMVGWCVALLGPLMSREWVFGRHELVRVHRCAGLPSSWRWEVQQVASVRADRRDKESAEQSFGRLWWNPASRWLHVVELTTAGPEVECRGYRVGFFDHADVRLFEIDELTWAEARWLGRTLLERYSGWSELPANEGER